MKSMVSRMLWVICLALLFSGVYGGFVSATVSISLNVELDQEEIDAGDSFNVVLHINNTDNEDLTTSEDIEVVINIDGILVHEDVDHEDIPQNSSKTLTISSTRFTTEEGDVWEKALLGFECDEKTVEVKLSGDVSASDKVNLDITGKKLYVGVKPDKPTPGSDIILEVEDDDGDPLDNVYVRITHLGDDGEWDMDDVGREDSTDDGRVTFNSLEEDFRFRDDPYGLYQLDVWDDDYCLFQDTFEVTNKLKISEVPETLYAGEEIRLRVLDIDDIKVENAKVTASSSAGKVGPYTSDSSGYVVFTIGEAGSYTLIASKDGYENSEFISVNVGTKGNMDIKIEPIKQAIGKDVTITVTSGGNPIDSAEVSIKKPDGKTDVLSTSSTGELTYKPALPGVYDITVKKTAYETTTSSFKAMNFFDVTIPEEIRLHEEISIVVKNQNDDPVEDATVALTGAGIAGLSSEKGEFAFVLETAGEYTISIKKEGYEDYSEEIKIQGGLQLGVTPKTLNLGDSVTITVSDDEGENIEVNMEITKPDRGKETVVKTSHTLVANMAGRYNITVSKEYYTPASSSFDVNPYSLDLDVWLSGKDLMIKATSEGEIVQNLSISILTPDGGDILLTTDASGIAKLDIKELNQTGEFIVRSVDRNYEEKTVTKEIKGLGGNLTPILLIVAVVIVLLTMVFFIFYVGHKKSKDKKTESRRSRGTGLSGL